MGLTGFQHRRRLLAERAAADDAPAEGDQVQAKGKRGRKADAPEQAPPAEGDQVQAKGDDLV